MRTVLKLAIVLFVVSFSVAEAAKSRASVRGRTNDVFRLSASMGLVSSNGGNGFGTVIGGHFRLTRNTPVYLGLETGIDVVGSGARSTTTGDSATAVGMPILASAYYEFVQRTSSVRPYVGVSMGPRIGLNHSQGTDLAVFFRPGLNFPLSRTVDLGTEARFGGVDGVFYMHPQANAVIKF